MGDVDGEELLFALESRELSVLYIAITFIRSIITYTTKRRDLLCKLDAMLIGNALEVDHHLRETRPRLFLPLSDVFHLLF